MELKLIKVYKMRDETSNIEVRHAFLTFIKIFSLSLTT